MCNSPQLFNVWIQILPSSLCPLKRATAGHSIESAGTGWGKPGDIASCSRWYFMNGAKIKSEEHQGEGTFGTADDTDIL